MIDGEPFRNINEFAYVETLPRELEFIFDVETIFKDYQAFK
jgi:hypothetical protein